MCTPCLTWSNEVVNAGYSAFTPEGIVLIENCLSVADDYLKEVTFNSLSLSPCSNCDKSAFQ